MHGLFGTKHIILLAISLVLVIGLYLLSRKMKFSTICKTLFYTGIVSELIKVFYYIIQNEDTYGGVLPKTDLPFQLCSIQIIFIIVVTFTKNEKLKRLILSFMLPSCLFGGIAAILIPTQSARNGMWIITAQYFLYHIALIIFSLHLFTSKELKLTIKDYFNCLKFLVGIMFFAIYINSMMYDGNPNINFMYVVSPPQDGLPYLNENQGWFMYMLKYASVVILCVSLVYIKPIISCIKEKFHKKSSDTASIQIADSIEDSTKSDTNE